MKMINLTPHTVNLTLTVYPHDMTDHLDHKLVAIPSDGIARVSQVLTSSGSIRNDGVSDFNIVTAEFGKVTGLPSSVKDTIYLVSTMVRLASPNRKDLYSPIDLIRDDQGRIIGAKSLIGNYNGMNPKWGSIGKLIEQYKSSNISLSKFKELIYED